MIKKITAAAAALAALITSAFAINPDTIGMYEKIDQIEIVELTGSNLTAVYFIVGIICVFIVAFYFWDKHRHKVFLKEINEEEQRNDEEKK